MNRLICVLLFAASCMASAQTAEKTVRICDASGCSDRPRSSASFDPAHDDNPEETRRITALEGIARQDPRAAYDLALRHFRGDGVKRDSYQAIQWMREAGDRGVPEAHLALGRFYLMGVEEMGADPVEAEKWLALAAGRGDKEAQKLLAEARRARRTDQDLYRWREAHRKAWYGWWHSGYPYHWHWGAAGWTQR